MNARSTSNGAAARAALRYTNVAVALHWLIGIGIILQIVMGFRMTLFKLAPADLFKLYQLHKSFGISILVLVVLRIVWRLTHRPPPLPPGMPKLEKAAAEGTHVLLYILMIGMPITGWMLVSASPLNIPTVLFGLVPWPHIPILSTLHDKAPVEAVLKLVHAYGGWLLLGIVGLHAAAALRHHFVLRDTVLRRMLPGRGALSQRPLKETDSL